MHSGGGMSQKKSWTGKAVYSTSKWSTKAAAHPNSTAHCQDVCITVWILLIQRGGRGDRIDTIEKQHINEDYLIKYIIMLKSWMQIKMFPDISIPDKLLKRRTWTCWEPQHRYWQCEQTGPEWRRTGQGTGNRKIKFNYVICVRSIHSTRPKIPPQDTTDLVSMISKKKKKMWEMWKRFTHLFAYRHPTAQGSSQTNDFSNKGLES